MPRFFSRKEYQEIADKFELGKIEEIEKFKAGLAAPKVVITTEKGKYVVAKYTLGKGENFKTKPKWALQNEIDLLTSLKELPTPKYISIRRGDFLLVYKGFGITAYHFLGGSAPRTPNEKKVFELGKFLGSFHKQGQRLRKNFLRRNKFYYLPEERIQKMRPHSYKQNHPKLKAVVEYVEKCIRKDRPPAGLPEGPIHVDLKHDNELFRGDTLTGVIDFGNFYVGPFMVDVGKAIIFNCTNKGKLDKNLVKTFLRGYEKYRKLTKREKAYLESSIRYAICSHIWLDLYHVPLKLVPENHTLYFVEKFLPAIRSK